MVVVACVSGVLGGGVPASAATAPSVHASSSVSAKIGGHLNPAVTVLNWVRLKNVATSRCLDDSTAYGNDVLRGYDCLGNDYQAWTVVIEESFPDAGLYLVQLRNSATGRCLDDSTAYGNDVLRGYTCLNNRYQEWWMQDYGSFGYELASYATLRCLDDSTAYGNDVLRGYTCNGLNYQRWYLQVA
jgi:hypothetical protein